MEMFSVFEVVSYEQVAFVLQMMSATVFEVPPVQAAGPAFPAAPQSLSVTRITAVDEMLMVSLNVIETLSWLSSVFARPDADAVVAVACEIGFPRSPPPPPMAWVRTFEKFSWEVTGS